MRRKTGLPSVDPGGPMGTREGPESEKGRWSGDGSGSRDGKERNTKVGPRLGTRKTPPCHWERLQRVGLEELVLGFRSEKGGRGRFTS